MTEINRHGLDNHLLNSQNHKPDFYFPKPPPITTPTTFRFPEYGSTEWQRRKPDFHTPLARSRNLPKGLISTADGSGGGMLDKQHYKPNFGIPTRSLAMTLETYEPPMSWSSSYQSKLSTVTPTVDLTCLLIVLPGDAERTPHKTHHTFTENERNSDDYKYPVNNLTKAETKFLLALTFAPIVATVWAVKALRKGIKYQKAQREAKAAREIASRPPFWESTAEVVDIDSLKDSKSLLRETMIRETLQVDRTSKEASLKPLKTLYLESETVRSDSIKLLKLCSLDGADDTDIEESEDDRDGTFPTAKSTASAETTVRIRTHPVRLVDSVWPGSLSPRFRSYRSLPRSISQCSLEMSTFDGSGSSMQRNEVRWVPLTSLKSSQAGGINEPSTNTAEVLVDVAGTTPRKHVTGPRRAASQSSLRGFGATGSDLGTLPPAEDSPRAPTPFVSETFSVGPGLVAPPPTDESSGITAPSPFATGRELSAGIIYNVSHHQASSATTINHCFLLPFQTASPATNRYHSETPKSTVEGDSSPPDSELEIELHNPAPVVEVTIEDRDDPQPPENPQSRTLTPHVQMQMDLLVLQLVDAIRGLLLLAARQKNPRDLLLVLMVAGLRFWQWFLNAMAGRVRNRLIETDSRTGEGGD